VCWKPRSSCWSFHLLREEILSAPIHSPLSGSPYRSFSLASDNLPVRTSSFRLRPRQGPRKCDTAPTHELSRNDAWGASSPRHANTPAGGTRGRPTLTRALMRHCLAVRPPTCRPVRPCVTPTPSEGLECPLRLALAYD
jgi:hypothetical protein